jgi:hypothetical protein
VSIRALEMIEGTSQLVKLVAETSVFHDIRADNWLVMLESAKDDLHNFTMQAVNSIDDEGLASIHYRVRIQELVIRINILEELISQLPDLHNNEE